MKTTVRTTVVFDNVDALGIVLRFQPLTAAAIARVFNISKPVAYERVKALYERGAQVQETKVREGKTGPLSTVYRVNSKLPVIK